MTGLLNRKLFFLTTFTILILVSIHPVIAQSIGETGLTFVAFSKNTFYGMNLGTTNGELRFRIKEKNKNRVLFIDLYTKDEFSTIAAMNDHSVFITYQNHFNSTNPVYLSPADFESKFGNLLFDNKRIPDPQNFSIDNNPLIIAYTNQLFASEFGKAFIVESLETSPIIFEKQQNWQILTSLPSAFTDVESGNGFFHPFQQKNRVESEIRKYISDFSLLDGFRVLQAAHPLESQTASVVFEPSKNQIYIVLDKEFEKIWMINLDGATIETFSGFDKYHKGNIPEIGITSSDLQILNFSNESLMDGVILWGVIIAIIIFLVTGVNYRHITR